MNAPVDANYEEVVRAPVDEVFHAWTDPEELKQWFGPNMFQTTEATVDLRVGGRYRLVMRAPDGTDLVITGAYEAIEPDRRLVYTWAWAHAPSEVMRVSVEFVALGPATTRVRIHHADILDGELERYASGWREGVARLRRLVRTDSP